MEGFVGELQLKEKCPLAEISVIVMCIYFIFLAGTKCLIMKRVAHIE